MSESLALVGSAVGKPAASGTRWVGVLFSLGNNVQYAGGGCCKLATPWRVAPVTHSIQIPPLQNLITRHYYIPRSH